ncbi:transglycosylase domain-containing protein [Oceanobacillus polygoni]|uniref:Penicillin-binding protein 2A n=1 Tax=Oceanobacillus polygoni TaxID=1235259 RepID=A0A9X0YQ42_9BACI|nr:transglycosylase domain-containing protein [Oceanobacillus polygoni]MBP2076638.1 penicillin-binding protein 2A [Oceanobacillus polygoni]
MRKIIKKEKRRLTIRRRLKVFLFMTVFLIGIGLLGYGAALFGGKLIVNQAGMVLDETTIIETQDGEVIGTLYNENRIYTPIDQIPEHLQQAYVAIEDRRFYDHAGIDMKSIARAVYKDIIAMSKVEGASTITQQLAKNLFLYNDKTWTRKIKEAMVAVYLEKELTKDQILELYMNEIYFGHGLYGVEVASNYFFSKSVGDLTIAESAMLAGLAKAPNGYSPINHPDKALNRRNVVLQAMENAGYISAETRIAEQEKTLGLEVQEKEAKSWTDSYIDLVMKEAAGEHQLSVDALKRGGYRIVVNMDSTIQKIAYEQFQHDEFFPGNTDGVEGAFVMMEGETGNVVSVIGGRNYQLGDLNRTVVKRQPGSTFKPVAVYGPALMQEEKYTPFTLLPDQQMDKYMVSNSDGTYTNAVTIYEALISSKNTSTVWLLDQIGVDYAKGYLEQLGMPIEDEGLSIALGGLTEGVTPLQLAESYRSFSAGGNIVEATTINRIFDRNNEIIHEEGAVSTPVFSPQVAWNMTEMLMETVNNGTAAAGDYSKALAGKTGTTQHPHVEGQSKDAWFVGYTPEYVTATWIGYDKSDKDHYLTGGSSYPTRLTKSILTEVDKQTGGALAAAFTKPDDVTELPKPIKIPQIMNLRAEYQFGGFSLVQGKLSWQGSDDDRVHYRIYQEKTGIDKRIDEVQGETEYVINHALFRGNAYYVVAYDPLTKLEGGRSEVVELNW